MSIERMFTQDLTILPYGESGVDDYNDPEVVAGTPVSVKGYLERRAERGDPEETRDRETALSRWRVFLPAGTSLTYRDRVTYDGTTFAVDGTPHEVWNPRTRRVHHIEADLLLVEG